MQQSPRLWDISQPLRAGMPTWPGDTPFASRRVWTMSETTPVNVGAFATSVHAGTHADAPIHYDSQGISAESLDLAIYLGRCRLIDLRECEARVEAADIEGFLHDAPPRLLIRTYERFPHEAWDSGFTAVSPEAIDRMAAAGVRLVGVDTASLDPETSKTMDAHKAVARHRMAILEGLVLDEPPPGDYELIALPLKLAGLDAAPVRAVLRELPL